MQTVRWNQHRLIRPIITLSQCDPSELMMSQKKSWQLEMRRQSKSSSRSRRNDKRRSHLSAATVPTYLTEGLVAVDPFQLSTCCVCGGIEDEDLIILCDGPGCNSEVHMYCLSPVMTAVPEGDWFCESCDRLGTTVQLRKYFADFEQTRMAVSTCRKETYGEWLSLLQQRAIPLENWVPSFTEELVPPEFDPSAEDLVGCAVRLSVSPTGFHTGRIINRRFNDALERWEHFIQFKRYVHATCCPT